MIGSAAHARPVHPLLKLLLEVGPLVAFFVANAKGGIFMGTAVFMGALVLSLGASLILTRHLPLLPLITAAFVLVFGGLTLWLQDDLFIKLKPTIVNGLFSAILLGGLAFGKVLLQPLLGNVLHLTDEGWRKLTLRWGLFFLVLAIVNELTWRNFSTDTWVNVKVFGNLPLTIIFGAAQIPLMQRYAAEKVAGDEGAER